MFSLGRIATDIKFRLFAWRKTSKNAKHASLILDGGLTNCEKGAVHRIT